MIGQKTGLFITRAQPGLHHGHLDGIKQGLSEGITKVLIGIGSANKEFTSENPFTYQERKNMVESSAKELLQNIEVDVFPIPDMGDNEKWKNYIMDNLPNFEYIMSGNARVQSIFKGSGKQIIPLEVRKIVKGSTIRGQIATRNMEELEKVLSQTVLEYLGNIDGFNRLRDIFNKERKTPSLTADIVLFTDKGKLVLIQRKNFPEGIALPGGFNDYGETGRDAAKREAKEEIGVDIEIEKELGVWDTPDRDPRAHNVARAFKCKIIGGELKAGDDAKAVIEVDPKDLNNITFAFPDHKEMILEALKKEKSN